MVPRLSPATRAEVEEVRGVDSGAVIKTLLERRLVRISGHKEVPGRPMLYSTSKRFLEVFGLESIKKLPSLRELEDLAREQGVELPGMINQDVSEEVSVEEPLEPGAVQGQDPTVVVNAPAFVVSGDAEVNDEPQADDLDAVRSDDSG